MRGISFVLIFVLSLSLIFSISYAGPDVRVFNIQLFKEDKILNMPINKISFWFEISPGISLGDNNFIEFRYSYSETILERESFITVAINGYPIGSRKIFRKGSFPVSWRVYIPKSRIKSGINEISVMTRHRSIEGLCKDIDNDANWVIIHKDSLLHIETYKDKDYKISYYPYPFLKTLSNNPVDFTLYLPSKPTPEEIGVMLEVTNGLGFRERYKDLYINVSLNDPYKDTEKNQILVGEISKWNILSEDKALKRISEGNGLIYLLPLRDKLQLYISGDKEGLAKAASYINNPKQVSITEKNPVFVTTISEEERNGETKRGIIRLRDLGYDNIILSGTFHQTSSFLISRPRGFSSIGSGSFIELHFRHSKVLEPSKSTINIYINGKPVKNERLTASNAENGTLRVSFPKDELNKKEWFVEIKTYHDIREVDCNKKYEEIAWTKIEGDSLVYLVKGWEDSYPDIEDLWLADERNSIILWLPDNPSSELLSLIGTLSARIGQESGRIIKYDVLIGDNINEESLRGKDIIFIGDIKDKRLDRISNALWIKPEIDSFSIKRNLGFSLDGFNIDALIQVDYSPWDKNMALYSILYRDQTAISKLRRVVGNLEGVKKIYGQVSIITRLGEVVSVSLMKERRTILSILTRRPLIIYIVVFLIAILATLVTIIIARRRMLAREG